MHQRIFCLGAALLIVAGCGGGSSSGGSSAQTSSGPAATVNLSASRTAINAGEQVTLTWSSNNATSCTASGGWSGTRQTSGSETVGPVNQTTRFTLSCSGAGGGGLAEVTVQVDTGSGVSVTLSANPSNVSQGGTTTLQWTAQNANTCTASGGWSGTQPLSGSFVAGPLNQTTSFQLSCDGPTGTGITLTTVQVLDKTLRWQAPTQNVDGTPVVRPWPGGGPAGGVPVPGRRGTDDCTRVRRALGHQTGKLD